MTNEELGYSAFFEDKRIELGFEQFSVARVASVHRDSCRVKNEEGEYLASVTGAYRHTHRGEEEYPAVGDWVVIDCPDNEHALIHAILPRVSVLKRKTGDRSREGKKDRVQIIAANIDVAFIVESVDRDYSVNRFERYCTLVEQGGVRPVLVLNKIDLISEEELREKTKELTVRFGEVPILTTSSTSSVTSFVLEDFIEKGKTYCFLGSSGVGKSSLINKLLEKEVVETGEISTHSERGKHTTTSRQMYVLPSGGIVVDNPGIREVGIVAEGDDSFFFELLNEGEGRCMYRDCTHTHEPGCVVKQAVELGTLEEEKYVHYLTLKKEMIHNETSEFEKRKKDKAFGKFKKKFLSRQYKDR